MLSSRVEVNGLRLHVDDYGGSGRVLWFAHATGLHGRTWVPVIRRLRRAGFDGRVLTYDARGHGLSSKPDCGYAWSLMADDLIQLLGRLEIEDAVGVGLSAGSTMLALAQAAQPVRFRRLLLLDPIILRTEDDAPPSGEDHHMSRRTERRRLVWHSRADICGSYAERPPYDRWQPEALNDYVQYGTFVRPDGEVELLCPGRIEAKIYRDSVKANPLAEIAKIKVPVHVVRAELGDAFTESRAARTMEALGDNARLTVIGQCGHFIPMENPDLVTDMILAEWGAC